MSARGTKNFARLRFNTNIAVFLFGFTLLLLASYTNGQVNADSTTSRTRRTRSPSSTLIRSSKGGPPAAVATVKTTPARAPVPKQPDRQTPTAASGAATATPAAAQTGPKSSAVKAEDGDSNDNDRNSAEEEEYEQNGNDDVEIVSVRPPSTRPPLASVVTAPMPRIPLETVFVAADQPTGAPCVAVKAGIRFTFSYANVSSGKVEQGLVDLPARNYSVDSECGQIRQRMSLIFSPDRHVSLESAVDAGTAWNLSLTFVRNGSEIFAERVSLRYVVQTGHLPFPWSINAAVTAVLHKPGLFRTPDEEHSFICMSDAGYGDFVIVVDSDSSVLVGASPPSNAESYLGNTSLLQPLAVNVNQSVRLQLIEFYNLQLQAYLKPPQQQSSSSETVSRPISVSFSTQVVQCSGDFISVKVPFVLGAILLVFVIAVVAVYMTRRLMHGKQTDEKRKSVDYRPVH